MVEFTTDVPNPNNRVIPIVGQKYALIADIPLDMAENAPVLSVTTTANPIMVTLVKKIENIIPKRAIKIIINVIAATDVWPIIPTINVTINTAKPTPINKNINEKQYNINFKTLFFISTKKLPKLAFPSE